MVSSAAVDAKIWLSGEKAKLIVESQTSGAVSSAPAYWSDTLFVGDANGVLYALKSQTGQQLWTYQTEDRFSLPPRWMKAASISAAWTASFTLLTRKAGSSYGSLRLPVQTTPLPDQQRGARYARAERKYPGIRQRAERRASAELSTPWIRFPGRSCGSIPPGTRLPALQSRMGWFTLAGLEPLQGRG